MYGRINRFLLITIFSLKTFSCFGIPVNWEGNSSTSLIDPSNWQYSAVPFGETAVFNNAGTQGNILTCDAEFLNSQIIFSSEDITGYTITFTTGGSLVIPSTIGSSFGIIDTSPNGNEFIMQNDTSISIGAEEIDPENYPFLMGSNLTVYELDDSSTLSFDGPTVGSDKPILVYKSSGDITLPTRPTPNIYFGILTSDNSLTTGTLHLNASTLNLTGNTLYNGSGNYFGSNMKVDGSGSIIFSGTVPTDIHSANSYTGTTTVANGTVTLHSDGTLSPASDLIVNSDGVFDTTAASLTIRNLSGSGVSAAVSIDDQTLTLNTTNASIYDGVIIGTNGSLIIEGTGQLTLTNPSNTYTGNTVIQDSAILSLTGQGNIPNTSLITLNDTATFDISTIDATSFTTDGFGGTSSLVSVNIGPVNLILNTSGYSTFTGIISGTSGSLNITGNGILTLTNQGNTYNGNTTLSGNSTLALAGLGTIPTNGVLNLYDTATLNLSGAYGQVNLGPIQSPASGTALVLGNRSVIIQQFTDTEYAGTIMGMPLSTFTVSGSGTLNLSGDSSAFAGLAKIYNHVNINGQLGNINNGSIQVYNGGLLSGNAFIGNLTVFPRGTVSPGNSVGIINVVTYKNLDGNYVVEIGPNGTSDLINASGAVTLSGGHVFITNLSGNYSLSDVYTIIQGANVTGHFTNASFINPQDTILLPALTYDTQHVYLTFATNLAGFATNCNQVAVAIAIDSISNPSSSVQELLNLLITVPINQVSAALNGLSGVQQTDDLWLSQIQNRQFIRRMYDPLRGMVTCRNEFMPSCSLFKNIGQNHEVTFWLEFGGGHTHLNNPQSHYSLGVTGTEITYGVHKSWCDTFAIGLAGSHEYDRLAYSSVAHGTSKTGFLGLYAIYRPVLWYCLADFAYGNSANTLSRKVDLGSATYKTHASPRVNQFSLYGELGYDLETPYALTQLFAGLEFDAYNRGSVRETGDSPINLAVHSRNFRVVYSRCGLHISSYRLPYNSFVSVDLAWNKKWSSKTNTATLRFDEFGSEYKVQGVNLDNNTGEATLTISTRPLRDWRFYGEASGEWGANFYRYNFQGGFEFLW